MILSAAILALSAQMGVAAPLPAATQPMVQEVQYRVPVRPPPCGHGWDVSARDGMCYPNGYLPPEEQAARRYGGGYYGGRGYDGGGPGYGGGPVYGGGRYPVPCGNGADVDIRDGQCYPNGTVPRRFQNRPRYYRY